MKTVHGYGGSGNGASQIMRYVFYDILTGFPGILFLPGHFFKYIQPRDAEGCYCDSIVPGRGFDIVIDGVFYRYGIRLYIFIFISGFDIKYDAYLLNCEGIIRLHAEYNIFAVVSFRKILFGVYRIIRGRRKHAYGVRLILAKIVKRPVESTFLYSST